MGFIFLPEFESIHVGEELQDPDLCALKSVLCLVGSTMYLFYKTMKSVWLLRWLLSKQWSMKPRGSWAEDGGCREDGGSKPSTSNSTKAVLLKKNQVGPLEFFLRFHLRSTTKNKFEPLCSTPWFLSPSSSDLGVERAEKFLALGAQPRHYGMLTASVASAH